MSAIVRMTGRMGSGKEFKPTSQDTVHLDQSQPLTRGDKAHVDGYSDWIDHQKAIAVSLAGEAPHRAVR